MTARSHLIRIRMSFSICYSYKKKFLGQAEPKNLSSQKVLTLYAMKLPICEFVSGLGARRTLIVRVFNSCKSYPTSYLLQDSLGVNSQVLCKATFICLLPYCLFYHGCLSTVTKLLQRSAVHIDAAILLLGSHLL
jgi:hypothetical protein